MEFSFIRKDITPLEEVDICGYGFSRGKTKEALEPIFCDIALIKIKKDILIFITLDTTSISKVFTDEVRTYLKESYGLKEEYINIEATHTHSGPGIFYFPDDVTEKDTFIGNIKYADEIKKIIYQSVEEALKSKTQVRAFYSNTDIQGYYGNRNNPNGDYDSKIYTILFKDYEGNSKGAIVNMSCHSTILKADNMKLSADLGGSVRKEIGRLLNISILMTIGAAGDVSSRFYVKEHDYKTVLECGNKIAERVATNNDNWRELKIEEVKVRKVSFMEDYNPKEDKQLLECYYSIDKTPISFMKETLKKRIEHGIFHINLEALIYNFGELKMILFPGELVTALGRRIQNAIEGLKIIICYSNDYWQYFVDEEEYGKYFETYNSICPKGMADNFVEKIIKELRKEDN